VDGDGSISLAELIEPLARRLAPEQVGLFEPLSGLMVLNVEEASYAAMSRRFADGAVLEQDEQFLAAINHEAYHFAQAAASGFMFDRQRTAMQVLRATEPPPDPSPDPAFEEMIARCREEAGDDPELNARIDRMVWVIHERDRLAMLEARAAPGDHSIEGALFPHLYVHFKERAERESQRNRHGLSIMGLLEGSAVIHTRLLMKKGEEAARSISTDIESLPPVYGELLAFTAPMAGDRHLEVALPATAIALCYARPHDAYCELVPMLLSAPAGEALARGRELFETAPAIPVAGPWLGDAVAQYEADPSYPIYDRVLDALRSRRWGFGSYEMMADPLAMHAIDSFPLGLVTRSASHSSFDFPEGAGRLILAGAALRSRSRRRDQREFEKFAVRWAQDVLNRTFGLGMTAAPFPPAEHRTEDGAAGLPRNPE
jgi:hypothetical protein